ncbi:EARLY FLOWERING-like protein [Perilla frutescens var. hirtella]|nr:EARLY FLOWERING-like protein [Perilla frutescens var. hirtella]
MVDCLSYVTAGGTTVIRRPFTQNFRQVQSVLDRNRALIQQINENHQSNAHNNLVKNIALIQEIKGIYPRSFRCIRISPPISRPSATSSHRSATRRATPPARSEAQLLLFSF